MDSIFIYVGILSENRPAVALIPMETVIFSLCRRLLCRVETDFFHEMILCLFSQKAVLGANSKNLFEKQEKKFGINNHFISLLPVYN